MANNQAFISLGTNLGNRSGNLKKAIQAIESNLGVIIKKSSVYETKPWGKLHQPDFLNQVILIMTDKTAQHCLLTLSSIENQMGRKRDEKWGARIIDLDLLYLDDAMIDSETLTLPHPGIPQRRFVLVPLVEIAPDFVHPRLQKNQQQLLDACTDSLEVKFFN